MAKTSIFTGPAYSVSGKPEGAEQEPAQEEPRYSESEFVNMLLNSPLGKFIGGTAKTVNDIIDAIMGSNILDTGPSLKEKINDIPNKPGSFTGKKSTILGG